LPIWLEAREVLHFHAELLSEHGGFDGAVNTGAVESTLARPQNRLAYEPESTIYELGASYGYGFAKNHCFSDGNKRVALVCIDVFLLANGYELEAEEAEAISVVRSVAAGKMSEDELSAWVELRAVVFDFEQA